MVIYFTKIIFLKNIHMINKALRIVKGNREVYLEAMN